MFKITLLIPLLFCHFVNAQTLNFYYGNIHAHSGYSDGNKDSATSNLSTPIEDFLYARQSLHTDFYGISEHNHSGAGNMGPYYFYKGLADADSATIDSQFVAMYGMEWGVISTGGHVILYGFDSLCGWDFGNTEIHVAQIDYSKLWQTVNRKKGCFAYFAHPQNDDYNNLLNIAYDSIADKAIAGTAMRSGPAFSTNNLYSNPATGTYLSQYNAALKAGYHLGVGLDHDTHNTVFDRQSSGRFVVMAPILNRAEIIEGIRRMRIYSSDDWNVKVNFSINNLPMGSIIENAGNPTLSVTVNDADVNETVSSIAIYYGVPDSGVNPTILTTVNNDSLTFTHTILNNTNYYYYLYIIQGDGNKIWTSPIWYNRNDNSTIQTPIANFKNSTIACSNADYYLQDSSLNEPTSWWWSIPGGYPAQSSLQNPTIKFATAGTYNVTLTSTNQAGTSASITKVITVVNPPNILINSVDTICKGKSVTLTATGGNSYVWNNGTTQNSITVQPNITTQYSVTGFDVNCKNKASKVIVVNQIYQSPLITANGDTLYSNFNENVQWYYNGTLIVGATQNSLLAIETGIYTFQIKDSEGCISNFSMQYNFQNQSAISELDASLLFKIFPNPTPGVLYVSAENPQYNLNLAVIDEQGKTILKQHAVECSVNNLLTIDLSQFGAGIYYLKLQIANKMYSSKIRVL